MFSASGSSLKLISLLLLLPAALALPAKRQAQLPSKSDLAVPQDFPGVPFEIPPSYAGNLPVSSEDNDALFFWYYPRTGEVGEDDLVVWLNGGPGCSSLNGLLQENGPWLLPYNATEPIKNEYSWTNLTNMVWITQPIGTGFTEGQPSIVDQQGVARQFIGFLKNFYATFPELQGKKLWLTGESYAGKYIPYIASAIYDLDGAEVQESGINLQGFHMFDPSFTQDVRGFGQDLPAVDYAIEFKDTLGLQDPFIEQLTELGRATGLYNFTEKHLQYPPTGPILVPDEFTPQFKPWNLIYQAAAQANPCFNVYQITDECPSPSDPLGFPPTASNSSADNWVNDRPGFKEAIHVDPDTTWYLCSPDPVFVGNGTRGDQSPPPDETVLPGVIERSTRSMITHGDLDFLLMHQGTELAIQNMTWAGAQGFQEPPSTPLVVDGAEKGYTHTERNLTFTLVNGSGHMVPEAAPAAAYLMLQYLLGQTDSLTG